MLRTDFLSNLPGGTHETGAQCEDQLKSLKPLLMLLGYYLLTGLLIALLVMGLPGAGGYLPVGGGDGVAVVGGSELLTGKVTRIRWQPVDKALELFLGISGALVLMLPVAWVYVGARRQRGIEQSFVLTLLMLPVAVAGIVIIVQNSLALAFSLAGIVAGVRFRLTLHDTLDAIYIFMSIGVGLAAGIAALEIAVVLTMFFNLAIVLLWQLDYAEDASSRRWFSRSWDPKAREDGDESADTAGDTDSP